MSGIITLLTDFGNENVYVGVMKGAIAQINPQIQVIDLTHQIPPQNIEAARFSLTDAYKYFPEGTVHLAVVDPGVGSKRRGIAVEFECGYLVGPDNGIFSGILAESPPKKAVVLSNKQYWRTGQASSTFHGRDIFAPVAAHLARGVNVTVLGEEIDPGTLVSLKLPQCQAVDEGIFGTIQCIDIFGNLITNIPESALQGKSWFVEIQEQIIPSGETYSYVEWKKAIALVGSHGWVEIAVNGGSAKAVLQVDVGEKMAIRYM